MPSDLDRWQAAVDGLGASEWTTEEISAWSDLSEEALPPLLEIARLAAGKLAWEAGEGSAFDDDGWSKQDEIRLDALLRKHTEVRDE